MSPEHKTPDGESPFGSSPPKLKPSTGPLNVGDAAAGTAPAPRRGSSRRTPATEDSVAFPVRLDLEEADAVDDWLRALRKESGDRYLSKVEAVRHLLRLAREHEPTHRALIRRLRR